jgi:hypothetical protein
VTVGDPYEDQDQGGIWVDWNRDGDFEDEAETIAVEGSPGYGPYTATITPPEGARLGDTCLRIRVTWTGPVEPCWTTDFGEVEDYTITVLDSSGYCNATSLYCTEYISRVEVGGIDNTSECENYADFTNLSTEMAIGSPHEMTITIVDGHASNEGAVWIDWNQDADFYDEGELIPVDGSPGHGPYTASVVPPPDAMLGETRLRLRLLWYDPIDPCGATNYGEVEDYTVVVVEGSSCPADFDGDGDVDTADLLFLLGAWGTPDGDVDGDGDTDTTDLLQLLGAWGECP